ncbi:Thymidylate kinase [Candidatus Zixiibacteriota bacterium]|nr:Thymidylate kinase [candidate division Zixibacteria bacterium]
MKANKKCSPFFMRKRGWFITFEGIDGSGKTTQLKLTAAMLRKHHFQVLVLREPGSTPVAEKTRKILLDKKNQIPPEAELFLYLAARADLVRKVIAPAIDKGMIILCDRFFDSTTAYQGYGRGLDIDLIRKLNKLAVGRYEPDITFLVDVDYKTSLKRRKKQTDRLESESRLFFNRVRNGFLQIARREKRRTVVLDGRRGAGEVFAEVKSCLKTKLHIK